MLKLKAAEVEEDEAEGPEVEEAHEVDLDLVREQVILVDLALESRLVQIDMVDTEAMAHRIVLDQGKIVKHKHTKKIKTNFIIY
jgi:hypothetical protein